GELVDVRLLRVRRCGLGLGERLGAWHHELEVHTERAVEWGLPVCLGGVPGDGGAPGGDGFGGLEHHAVADVALGALRCGPAGDEQFELGDGAVFVDEVPVCVPRADGARVDADPGSGGHSVSSSSGDQRYAWYGPYQSPGALVSLPMRHPELH